MVWVVCSFATMMVISGCDYRSKTTNHPQKENKP